MFKNLKSRGAHFFAKGFNILFFQFIMSILCDIQPGDGRRDERTDREVSVIGFLPVGYATLKQRNRHVVRLSINFDFIPLALSKLDWGASIGI